jgi:GMP synthase-like glutamine amidotransferase
VTTRRAGPRVLVFQHLSCEHPGSLGTLLRAAGMSLHTVELDEGQVIPDLQDFDLMVVMGGPMDVWQEDRHPWMTEEKAAIRTWVGALERPYIGVCLGHQLLADAMGGRVGLMERPEIGVCRMELTAAAAADPLFAPLPPAISGLQWHGAQVVRLPERSVVLATNPACPIQAFRYRRRAWGVQFHMEVGASTIDEWAEIPEYRQSLEQSGIIDAAGLRAAVKGELATMEWSTAQLAQRLVVTVEGHVRARTLAQVMP